MTKPKVLIIESSFPKDFYGEQLDGPSTRHLVKVLGIETHLLYALDRLHFEKAIKFGKDNAFDVVHVSCHGGEEGLALANKTSVSWSAFAEIFVDNNYSPKALVMSACWGGSDPVGDAFKAAACRPNIIFGSTDARFYNEYAVAWAILYNMFLEHGTNRDAAVKALEAINAIVDRRFRYLRWDESRYRKFPGAGRRYEIREVESD